MGETTTVAGGPVEPAIDITASDDPWAAGILTGSMACVGPEHVVVDLTNCCNMRCLACWTKSPLLRDKTPPDAWHRQALPVDLVIRLIDELAHMGTRIVRFTGGGEPLLHPDCITLLRRIKDRGMRACLTTNLAYLGPPRMEELLATGLDELAVSVWAADASMYRQLHPDLPEAANVFARVTDALGNIGKRKPNGLRVTISNLICNLNYRQIRPMIRYAENVGADSVYFALVDPVPGRTDCLLLSPDERAETLAQIDTAVRDTTIEIENLTDICRRLAVATAETAAYDSETVKRVPCTIGWTFCRILADGTVVPCCRAVMKPMGNLNADSFKTIWHSEDYNNFRGSALAALETDRYFRDIGCGQSCDNVAHNRAMYSRLPDAWRAGKHPGGGNA